MGLRRIVGLSGRLRAGDLVEVRSREELLATLDRDGKLDGMPFQAEMLRYCGQQFRVLKVANKACDTVHYSGIRRITRAVHLDELRCDGAAHGGCQATCLFFWKEAWLRPVSARNVTSEVASASSRAQCTIEDLERAACRREGQNAEPIYQCQVTEILRASRPWAWWNPSQYIGDFVSGNWSAGHVFRVLTLAILRRLLAVGVGYRILLRLHDSIARRHGMHPFAVVADQSGPLPAEAPTPASDFVPAAGDLVRVRSRAEILATLNRRGRNRGMYFDVEMVAYCGGQYRVSHVVKNIIDEGSGKMMTFKNPCIALQGVACRGEYSSKRLMCPRSIVPYWRPIWLEKLPERGQAPAGPATASREPAPSQ